MFSNVSFRCIKGQPIHEVIRRDLRQMGFPVEAPPPPDLHFMELERTRCYWKLSETEFSVCGRVETEYLHRLLQSGDREGSLRGTLELLAPYGVLPVELVAQLKSGCVYDLTPREAATLPEEFRFLIGALLPRQIADLYNSFDLLPNPAHGVFYDLAVEQMGLTRQTDRRKPDFGQLVGFPQAGLEQRLRAGTSLQTLYETTCATKEMILQADGAVSPVEGPAAQDPLYQSVERRLFRLARKYRYTRQTPLTAGGKCYDFLVWEGEKPRLAIDLAGETYIRPCGQPFVQPLSYKALTKRFTDKRQICREQGVSYLLLDLRELSDHSVDRLLRAVLQNPAEAQRHHDRRQFYYLYGRAVEDAQYSGDVELLEEATLCGCFACTRIFSPTKLREQDIFDEAAACPFCGDYSVLLDSQGYKLTPRCLEQLHAHLIPEEHHIPPEPLALTTIEPISPVSPLPF